MTTNATEGSDENWEKIQGNIKRNDIAETELQWIKMTN